MVRRKAADDSFVRRFGEIRAHSETEIHRRKSPKKRTEEERSESIVSFGQELCRDTPNRYHRVKRSAFERIAERKAALKVRSHSKSTLADGSNALKSPEPTSSNGFDHANRLRAGLAGIETPVRNASRFETISRLSPNDDRRGWRRDRIRPAGSR